jgi:hypothetical protein
MTGKCLVWHKKDIGGKLPSLVLRFLIYGLCHWRTYGGLPQLSSFYVKSQVFEIHKHEKHFKVSLQQGSHRVKVSARIYFSIVE